MAWLDKVCGKVQIWQKIKPYHDQLVRESHKFDKYTTLFDILQIGRSAHDEHVKLNSARDPSIEKHYFFYCIFSLDFLRDKQEIVSLQLKEDEERYIRVQC